MSELAIIARLTPYSRVSITTGVTTFEQQKRKQRNFECHDGTFVTGVALKGTVVKL